MFGVERVIITACGKNIDTNYSRTIMRLVVRVTKLPQSCAISIVCSVHLSVHFDSRKIWRISTSTLEQLVLRQARSVKEAQNFPSLRSLFSICKLLLLVYQRRGFLRKLLFTPNLLSDDSNSQPVQTARVFCVSSHTIRQTTNNTATYRQRTAKIRSVQKWRHTRGEEGYENRQKCL